MATATQQRIVDLEAAQPALEAELASGQVELEVVRADVGRADFLLERDRQEAAVLLATEKSVRRTAENEADVIRQVVEQLRAPRTTNRPIPGRGNKRDKVDYRRASS